MARLREKSKSDSRYNYLLRQSGREYRSYTLVYRNPPPKDVGVWTEKNSPQREPVCLQIKQMPESGLYQLVVDGGSPVAMASVQELVAHYRRNTAGDAIALQNCVVPSGPCKPSSRYFDVCIYGGTETVQITVL